MSRPWRLTSPVPTENDVEAGCLTILELHKYLVQRIQCGLFRSWDERRALQGEPKGSPDYTCTHERHRNFLMEVKRPGGRLSEDQVFRIRDIEERYRIPIVVVHSVDELCNFLAVHERSP